VTARRVVCTLALAIAAAGCSHGPGVRLQPPPGAAGTRPDSAGIFAPSTAAILPPPVDSLARALAADSLRHEAFADSIARADSLHGRKEVVTRSGARATAGKPAPVPPLRISADNVTGSRAATGDVVNLNGNVRITRGKTVITAESGRYEKGVGMLYLDNHVKLVDSTTTLTCDHAQYSEDNDVLQVSGKVVVHDRDAVMRAPLAIYDRRAGRAELFDGVEAQDKQQKMTGQRVVYHRNEQRIEARGGVVGEDKENNFTLRADSVDYDRVSKDAYARGNPRLESKDEDGRVGTLSARRLWLNTDTRIARAVDSVRVVRDTLEARADSARFDDRGERGWLYGHPRAWDRETNVTGDTLEIWTRKRQIDRFVVLGNANIDYKGAQANTIGEASRLTGERIEAHFSGQVMDSLRATGKARNAYTSVARPGKTAETNDAIGDTINVYFKNRKIDIARVLGQASGEYHFAVDTSDTSGLRNEIVRYDAPSITFHVPQNRIVLEPIAHMTYREMELKAGRVEFDSEQQTLTASGDPELMDKGDKVTGHLMTYDLENRTGNIYQAETTYERGLYHGAQIRKSGENELDVKAGQYSTCDLPQPHYHFQSKWMKIKLRDKMVAKPVVFYIENVPMLALPFWIFPIKPGRHSGILLPNIELGLNSKTGQFIRNFGYYWAPSDYYDMTFSGDYYQLEPSWKAKYEANYRLLYKLDGDINASYLKNEFDKSAQWDLITNHTQVLTPRTNLVAGAEFVSDRSYRRDPSYGNSLAQRLDRFLVSKLSVSHNADWASLNVFLDRRQDLDADETLKYPLGFQGLAPPAIGTTAALPNLTESLPNASISFPTRSLSSFPGLRGASWARPLQTVYFTLFSQLVSFHERRAVVEGYVPTDTLGADSTTVIGQQEESRRALSNSIALRDSRRLFGWFNFAPQFNANVVVFDHDVLGNTIVPTGTWSGSVSGGTTMYGTFRTRLGALTGLRHVIAPTVSYVFSPEFPNLFYTDSFGAQRPRFEGFGGIGVSGSQTSFMRFALDQRLQAKLKRGDHIDRLDNLLSWSMSGTYDFLAARNGSTRPLSPITSVVRLQPPGVINGDLSWSNNFYESRIVRSLSYNVNMYLSGGRTPITTVQSAAAGPTLEQRAQGPSLDVPWSLALAYSYSGGYATPIQWTSNKTLNGVLSVSLTPNWRGEYLASYDVGTHQMLTQRFGLTRDLHCWQASFSRTFVINGESEYYFRIGIKEQREVFYERGSRAQSFGGIY
jgi:lipopolysaccharide assembly outer membrane protein LptD (OstA)